MLRPTALPRPTSSLRRSQTLAKRDPRPDEEGEAFTRIAMLFGFTILLLALALLPRP